MGFAVLQRPGGHQQESCMHHPRRIPIFTVMKLTMKYVNWSFVSDNSIVLIYSMSAALGSCPSRWFEFGLSQNLHFSFGLANYAPTLSLFQMDIF
jgi:hypothetical protein